MYFESNSVIIEEKIIISKIQRQMNNLIEGQKPMRIGNTNKSLETKLFVHVNITNMPNQQFSLVLAWRRR